MAALVRTAAVLACAVVALSFVLFAVDEAGKGSSAQQEKLAQELNEPAPSAGTESRRERRHSPAREVIDDANDVLLSPFTGVTSSDNVWARRGIPTLLALLAYGVGLMLLANFLPKPRARSGDWRTAKA